jgi:hypothetical protein
MPVRRPAFTTGLAAALLLATVPAAADTVSALRSTELVERAHTVTVALGHGHARLTVRRTVFNGGARHDQATYHLDVPGSAVAIALRTRGMVDGAPRWYPAALLEAEAAAAKYKELTGVGGYYPKDPALLSWRHPGELALQVFPVAPQEEKMVEYTLLVPTSYVGGRDQLDLGVTGLEGHPASVTVEPEDAGDRVHTGDRTLAPGAAVVPTAEAPVTLSLERAPGTRRVDGALAVVPLGPERVILRQRLETAARLAEVPRGARVVVLIDASRSLSKEEVAAEVAAARAYVSHFADAQVETLLFDRHVTSVNGGFVPAAEALARLDRLTVTRHNGSRVDDALARAGALLAAQPGHAPRRVVALTDARTRAGLTPERLRALATSTGAVVHIGLIDTGSALLQREDGHPWDKVTRPTGGLVWSARASAGAEAEMRACYEEWARPRHVDKVRVSVPGLAAADFGYPERLDEGQGWEDTRLVKRQVGWLKIEGELWSTPVSTTLVPDAGEARVTAALVFGNDRLASALTEREMGTLARLGHAVSPVTSLLAVEPGVRPSTEGIEEGNMWGDEIGESFGAAGLGLNGFGEGGGGPGLDPDRKAWLRGALASGYKACGGGERHARVTFETTSLEVVDVTRVSVAGDADGKVGRCLEETAWGVELPPSFVEPHEVITVDL